MPSQGTFLESEDSSGVRANVRDASFVGRPRHDGVGGHRPGEWSPKWHVSIDHPTKGESWSACGKAFLIEGGVPVENVPTIARCQSRGCRERWPAESRGDDIGQLIVETFGVETCS